MSTQIEARRQRRVTLIKALAHPSRLAIAEALQDGERCVCDLRELVGSDLSTVSKHLTVMREAGLLELEKRGLNVYYRLKCPCLLSFFECVDALVPDVLAKKRRKI
ncbi:MAG: metalloregulator ArsR/SmtB family transcription factor [Verrucomicrobiales bacterium]